MTTLFADGAPPYLYPFYDGTCFAVCIALPLGLILGGLWVIKRLKRRTPPSPPRA